MATDKCIKCGSYAFNLYKEDIDQGGLCDVHYWQYRAHRAEALAEQPAQQEPVGCEGAVVNGRVYADRLEHDYKFECEAGPLHMCTDWVEFRRCFEWLAQHTAPPAQRTWVGLTDAETKHLWEVSRAAIPRYQTFKTLIKKTLKERNT